MNFASSKKEKRARRRSRIRSKIHGTLERPRLSVFKSNKYLFAQIINDDEGKTLASLSSKNMKKGDGDSHEFGKELAKVAAGANIKKVVFDRSGYIFTGKIKALADGAREGGLDF